MNDLQSYKKRINELSEMITKLEAGELTVEELVKMEELTRELHERSIILKYKAFEAKSGVVVEETVSEEPVAEESIVEEPVEEVEEEEPAIDFSIFDEPEAKEEEQEEPVIESIPEPEPISTSIPEPPKVPEPEVIEEPEMEVEEHTSISKTVEETDDMIETTIETKHTSHSTFLDKLKLDDNSLASQFSGGKIDSLIGAFGLNQRLRFINNLFDGSSELFSDAVKALDSQSNLDDAQSKAAEIAEQQSWDPEEENVIEFMTYVNRRYA